MIENLILAMVGIVALIFNNALAQLSVGAQGKFYHHKFGPNMVKFARVMFILVGAIFIVIGILDALGVIKFW